MVLALVAVGPRGDRRARGYQAASASSTRSTPASSAGARRETPEIAAPPSWSTCARARGVERPDGAGSRRAGAAAEVSGEQCDAVGKQRGAGDRAEVVVELDHEHDAGAHGRGGDRAARSAILSNLNH
ncbi:MAG: hypothetical protein E6J91_01565 [Deltaproteobacteria bacterium]|nr:MAG: hypothetical protein E6J91_01565 [Deltaproteobacteria bacterium]